MGSAKKSKIASKATKTAPVVQVVPAVVVAPVVSATPTLVRGTSWSGYTTCHLLRALGYAGYTAKQGSTLLPLVGIAGVSPSTVGCQVGAGRQYARGVATPHHTGNIAPLAGAVLAEVVKLVGDPALPHATTAPMPVKGVVVVTPPVAPVVVAPPVPVAAPSKPSKVGKKAK